jgi:hypothetical protein
MMTADDGTISLPIAPGLILVMRSPNNYCWFCQSRFLSRAYSVYSEANGFALYFLVCSNSCATAVRSEVSGEGVRTLTLSPEETTRILSDPRSICVKIDALRIGDVIRSKIHVPSGSEN